MLRRQARLRREYLYKKANDARELATFDRKRKVKEALATGQPLPTELRGDADKLRAEVELEDASRGAPSEGIDSEYANAAVADPKVLVTTSHDPSSKLTQFLKEVKLLVPNSQRMNRGGHTVDQIVDMCRGEGYSDLVVVQEHRGVPDGIVVSHMPYGPTAYFGLHNVVMRHDIQDRATVSEAYPHLVQHNLSTRVGKRVATILKHLFPVPKADSRRVVSMVNQARSARTDFALHSLCTCYTRYALAPLAALAAQGRHRPVCGLHRADAVVPSVGDVDQALAVHLDANRHVLPGCHGGKRRITRLHLILYERIELVSSHHLRPKHLRTPHRNNLAA